MLNTSSAEVILLSLHSAYIYRSISRTTAHQNPHTFPAAYCPLTTKQQARDGEYSGHKSQRQEKFSMAFKY